MEKISLRLSSPCLLSHLGLKVVLQPSHFRCLLKGENNGGRGVQFWAVLILSSGSFSPPCVSV